MPQCTSAASARVERAGPAERHARRDRLLPSIDRWTGRISTNATSRRQHDSVRCDPEPIRSGRGGARLCDSQRVYDPFELLADAGGKAG